jgi:hypothetical protein
VLPDDVPPDDAAPEEELLDEDVLAPDELLEVDELAAPDELLEDEASCAVAFIGEDPPPQPDASVARATDIVTAQPALSLYCRCFT